MKQHTQTMGTGLGALGTSFLAFHRDPLGYLETVAAEQGDVGHFRMGFHHAYLLNHPDMIKQVWVGHNRDLALGIPHRQFRLVMGDGLVTSEGAAHLEQRRRIQPAMHRNAIAALAQIPTEYAARWCAEQHAGAQIDVARAFATLTLNNVALQLFGVSVERQVQALLSKVERFTAMASPAMVYLAEALAQLPLPITRIVQDARASLDESVAEIIAEHRRRGDMGDILSMIMEPELDDGMGRMDDTQLHDQIVTLLLAGYVSTALALMWTFYLLWQDPSIEARVHAELDATLGKRLATIQDLGQLTYTRRVVMEAMRMYPPFWGMDRKVAREFSVGEHLFREGAIVIVSQWITHHDARYFPEPTRFDPERWTPEQMATRPPLSYLPFGVGPRVCVAEDLAWMNVMLLLATIAQRWKLRVVPEQRIALLPRAGLTNRYGMWMELEARK